MHKKLKETYPHVRARSSIDPFLFQGRSFIYNRQTPNHTDKREPLVGWNPLFVTGQFTGGRLRVRRLGLRMWFGPGACIWVRGRILAHEVEPFDGGQRISVASFMHQSVYDTVGVQPRSTGIKYSPEAPKTGVPLPRKSTVVKESVPKPVGTSSETRHSSRIRKSPKWLNN